MRLLIFGLGYTATRVAAAVRARGGEVAGTTRDGRGGTLAFDHCSPLHRHPRARGDRSPAASPITTGSADAHDPSWVPACAGMTEEVRAALDRATHVLSSIPPAGDIDPVLTAVGDALAGKRLAYLSSTGVYGDTGGAWVDESAPTGTGRRSARAAADAEWLALGARVLRLPGIYGPGRSPLDRVSEGRAHRTGIAGQVFSRCHVDDIVAGVLAAFDALAGAYNLADDHPCAQDEVVEHAARLLGLAAPPLVALDRLSPMARGFYAENRRVATAKAKRVLGWTPRYPDYRAGLRALSAITSPTPASTAPVTASADQR